MTDQHKILMDAGLSGKKTKELLAKVGVAIEDLDMVFLSHDHGDHSGGMGVLMRRYPQLNAFGNTGTWKYLEETGKIGRLPEDQINVIEPGQTKCYGDLEVTAFATSHDAAQPQYYVFSSGGKRLACLTDTGYVSEEVEYEIQDADAYLLEFNYDDLMLRSGPLSLEPAAAGPVRPRATCQTSRRPRLWPGLSVLKPSMFSWPTAASRTI